MFSGKAMKNAEACRFCWMCRHVCPVALQTGNEVNTPRAKGLLVSMTSRGYEMDRDCARIMYECLLCGACTNDCATGFEPPVFIREARTEALLAGCAPAEVEALVETILATGNPFGERLTAPEAPGARKDAKTLVWLGATARARTPQIAAALCSLLNKAGVAYRVMENEPDNAVALSDLMGFVEDARARAAACAEALNQTGAETLVTLDSYDAEGFAHRYADWGVALKPRVVTATAFVAELVAKGALSLKKTEGCVTYHDPSRLARDLDEHEPARSLIAASGLTLKEMFLNRRLAKCCGNALVAAYDPKLVALTASGRWEDALRTGADTLLTACPQAFVALSQSVPDGMRLQDLFVLLDGLAVASK